MAPERMLHPGEAQWVVQALARGILTVGLILGSLIIIGGEERWSSPSYEKALTYPYAPESWGWLIGIAAVVGLLGSLTGRLKAVTGALFVCAVWNFFFSMSFIQTAASNPDAATTGIPIYLGLAVACVVLGVAHWRSAPNVRHG